MPATLLPFDLRMLEIFLAVCDAGSMSGAARALRITQPAVSQAIAELEARTGVTLLDRAVRPLGLTPAGGVLRQQAGALLAEARRIAPMLRDTEHRRLALLRVGLVDSLMRLLATRVAAHLATRADQVAVLSGLTAAHASALLTRELDLFIGADAAEDVAGLERWPLITERYVLLLPPGAPPPATLGALARLGATLPLVRFSARSQTGSELARHLRRLALALPGCHAFDTPHGVAAMVAEGAGMAIATPLCVHEAALPAGALQVVPLPGPALTRTLTLVARRHELGALPRGLATAAAAVLATTPALGMADDAADSADLMP